MPPPAELYRWARGVVIAAWNAETGRDPTLFQAQCVQALCLYESGFGQWSGDCKDSHNWGSVHAVGSQPGCDHVDHHADGSEYFQKFRVYPTDLDGCRDAIRKMRIAAGAELDAGESTDDVWRALYYGHYYGARCPKAVAKYGAARALQTFGETGKPATTEAGRACEEECIRQGQDRAAHDIARIASVMGEPVSPRSSSSSPGAGGESAPLAAIGAGLVLALLVLHAAGR